MTKKMPLSPSKLKHKYSPRNGLLIAFVCCTQMISASSGVLADEQSLEQREFYQLQIYRVPQPENRDSILGFLKDHSLPAMNRFGIETVGVFFDTSEEPATSDVFVLVPFQSVQQVAELNEFLLNDKSYQTGVVEWSDIKLAEPRFTRIDTRLLKSFSGMPVMELADYSIKKDPKRVFELRIYESHTLRHAQSKVQMFNAGEIQLMKDVEMGPVFFAEAIAGPDVPCLVYMLSAADLDSHKAHWQAFLNDPRWPEMRDKPEYKDTVSKIQNWTLQAAEFSGM